MRDLTQMQQYLTQEALKLVQNDYSEANIEAKLLEVSQKTGHSKVFRRLKRKKERKS